MRSTEQTLTDASGRGASLVGLGFLLLAIGGSFLQGSVMAMAMPEIGAELGIRTDTVALAATLMIACSGAALISAGRLSDRLGRRRMCLMGIAVVVFASVVVATADGAIGLLAGRAIQGIGTAMLLTAIGLISLVYGEGPRRRLAFSLLSASVGLGLALAPLLAHAALSLASWRAIFWLNVPLFGLASVGIVAFVPESRNAQAETALDWPGTALLTSGVIALLVALGLGHGYGFTAATPRCAAELGWPHAWSPIAPVLALGLAAFAGFAKVERRRSGAGQPVLVDPELFRSRSFTLGLAVSFLFVLGGYALQFLVPAMGRVVEARDPAEVAGMTAMSGFGIAAGGVLSGRVAARLGGRDSLLAGVGLAMLSLLALAIAWPAGLGAAALSTILLTFGIGYGVAYARTTDVTLVDVPVATAGLGSGVLVASRTIAMALGAAALTSLTAHAAPHANGPSSGTRLALVVSSFVLALALATGQRLHRHDRSGRAAALHTTQPDRIEA